MIKMKSKKSLQKQYHKKSMVMTGVAKKGRSVVMLDLDGTGLQRSVSSRNSMTQHQTCGAWVAASTSLCR